MVASSQVEPSDRLARSFFGRHAPVVARDLLGCELVARAEGPGTALIRAVVVEVEAYDQDDAAAHTFRGRTPRNAVMFGPPGHLYTYFTYGMHWCANIVTGAPGRGEAVLLRAARVVEGEEAVRNRRGETVPERDLLRGPARLAQGLGLGRQHDGLDLLGPDAVLQVRSGSPSGRLEAGPRVGVRHAADVPWRFSVAGDRYVSAYRRHPGAPPPVR